MSSFKQSKWKDPIGSLNFKIFHVMLGLYYGREYTAINIYENKVLYSI